MRKILLLLVVLLVSVQCVAREKANFKLSLWDETALATPANIRDVSGIDFGLGSTTETVTGLQFDLIFANTEYEMRGASCSLLVSSVSEMIGAQIALLNHVAFSNGAQVGFLNLSNNTIIGAQVGIVNQAEYVKGVQFGILNYARIIEGVQLGLINIAENGYLPAMVFINGRF